jgi:hypothetical protein
LFFKKCASSRMNIRNTDLFLFELSKFSISRHRRSAFVSESRKSSSSFLILPLAILCCTGQQMMPETKARYEMGEVNWQHTLKFRAPKGNEKYWDTHIWWTNSSSNLVSVTLGHKDEIAGFSFVAFDVFFWLFFVLDSSFFFAIISFTDLDSDKIQSKAVFSSACSFDFSIKMKLFEFMISVNDMPFSNTWTLFDRTPLRRRASAH